MSRIRIAVFALFAACVAVPSTGNALDLFNKDRMSLEKGAKVTIKGNTARIKRGGGGGTGVVMTVQCACSDAGTCTLDIDKSSVNCYKGAGATCNASCELRGVTTGFSGGMLMQ